MTIISRKITSLINYFLTFCPHYLQKRGVGPVLHSFNAVRHSPLSLQVVQVKRLFTGAQDAGDGCAITYSEAYLHVDPLRCPPVDVCGEQPVVLAGLKHVAHLVCSDGVEVLIISAHLLPLGIIGKRGRCRGGWMRRDEAEEERRA